MEKAPRKGRVSKQPGASFIVLSITLVSGFLHSQCLKIAVQPKDNLDTAQP